MSNIQFKKFYIKNKSVITFLAIILISSFTLIIIRSHSYGEPVEFNSAEYSLVGNEILKGNNPYSVLNSNLPGHFPVIYYIYSVSIFLLGLKDTTITTIGIFFSLITLISIGIIFYRSFDLKSIAISTLLFAIFSSDVLLHGNQPSIELVLNSFILLSLLFLFEYLKVKKRWKLFISSSFLVLSVFTKPVTIIFLLFLIFFIIFANEKAKSKLLNLAVIISPIIILFSIISFLFIFNIWDPTTFIKRTIGFSSGYALNPLRRLPLFFVYLKYAKGTASLWIIGFFYLLYKSIFSKEIKSKIIFSFLICSLIGLTLPGTYFAYYYYLAFPYILIGTAIFLNDFVNKITVIKIDKELRTTLIIFIIAIVIIPSLYFQFKYYLLKNPNQISEIKYGNIFITTKEFSNYISAITEPEDKIFLWGRETEIFFYTNRKHVDNYLYFWPSKDPNEYKKQELNLKENLNKEKPELIIIGKYYTPPEIEMPFLSDFIKNKYSKIFENTQFRVYRKL